VIGKRPNQQLELAGLSPAYFGMVMATGIVSLAAYLLAMPGIAQALFQLNVVVYAGLWFLTVLRAVRYPRRDFGDMVDHLRGPGFFTSVAGTSVLGSQFVVLAADYRAGTVLWVVATQSIAVLSALLAAHLDPPARLEMNFLALSMWLWGGMLYIWMMSLIFYRYTFFRLVPGDLSPPYWINMGAMAISTLAGSLLIVNAPGAPFLLSLLPFITGGLRPFTGRRPPGGFPCWSFSRCGATCTGASR